jgi:hypothetical protein
MPLFLAKDVSSIVQIWYSVHEFSKLYEYSVCVRGSTGLFDRLDKLVTTLFQTVH